MAKLYFYYASMNAGKSTTLLQADFNYREQGPVREGELLMTPQWASAGQAASQNAFAGD